MSGFLCIASCFRKHRTESHRLFCFILLDLRELFDKVGLSKYFSIFQEQEVNQVSLLRELHVTDALS